jgi:peptide/nickel transport system permease protein
VLPNIPLRLSFFGTISSALSKGMMKKTLYLLRRFLSYAGIVFIAITLSFFITHLMPGDPTVHILGEQEYFFLYNENPEMIAKIQAQYGLDKSMGEQYVLYLKNLFTGKLAESFKYNVSAMEVILFRLKWTMVLVLPATAIAAFLGAVLGSKIGWKNGRLLDKVLTPTALVFRSVPTYCLAIFFLFYIAFKSGRFPISGMTKGDLYGFAAFIDVVWHMILPLTILVLSRTATNMLLMKHSVLDIKHEAYITTAVSKGLSDGKVLRKHVFRNALLPYVTSIAMQFGFIVSGSIMVEIIFAWKGMGTLIYEAVQGKDFPMLQMSMIIIVVCVVTANLTADILITLIDPRIKEADEHA